MENRIIFQMGETALKNKILLGTIGERGKNPSVDRGISICVGSNCQKEIYAQAIPLRNTADNKHIHF